MTPPVLWRDLRRHTAARVGLGRVGNGLPTAAHLDFEEAHARARDAVHSALDVPGLAAVIAAPGLVTHPVASQATDRRGYLLRPDFSRTLRAEDTAALSAAPMPGCIVFFVADGLCASGVQHGAPALLAEAAPMLVRAGLTLGPVVIAVQARVALGDAIGEALGNL